MENLKRIYVKLFEGTYKNGKFFGKKKKKKKLVILKLKNKVIFQ